MKLERMREICEGATPGPWRRKPLTYWNDRGKNENHNWNLIDGAETAEGYGPGMGLERGEPWGGAVRTEPRYIALPDAEFIATFSPERVRLLLDVVEAARNVVRNVATGPDGLLLDDDIAVALDKALEALGSEGEGG